MASTVIVALPAVDEKVYRISSEKVPHLTLLYLGDAVPDSDLADIVQYVQHAAKELSPFWLTVDYRGTLGPDDADVLFFEKDHYDIKRIASFRHHLLLDDKIKRAYDSVDQYPEWTPHLTLGYPATPAHKDTDEHSGIRNVDFDRIAVWTDDFDGPEFRLKYQDYAEVAMSGMSTLELGEAAVAELLHSGVKGMKWGVRKDREASKGGASKGPTAVVVTQKKPGKYAKSEGGHGHPLHEDARIALEARQKAKASTTDALSNSELRKAVERMNLEKQYTQLQFESDRRSKGLRFVSGLFGQKRYSGEKRRYADFHEETGEQTAKAAKEVADLLKEMRSQAG